MPKRQIIILALTGLVVLYGAYTYLLEPLLAPPTLASLDTAEIQKTIDDIHSELDKAQPAPLQMYRLELAQGEMPDNPFYASTGEVEETPIEQADGTDGPVFTYAGYVEMGGSRLAIVNGLDYMPGEELAEAGYFLTRIDRNKIVIEKRNGDMKVLERITAPLKDDFAIVSEDKDEEASPEQ